MSCSFGFCFWGVRGSVACPNHDFSGFGGNTSCVSVWIGDSLLVFDAGTGIRDLGGHLLRTNRFHFNLFMSHTHWDHICGFPFFAAAYDPRCQFSVYCGRDAMWGRPPIQSIMEGQMLNPLFPVPLGVMQSRISWNDFKVGDSLSIVKDVTIRTAPLNHPSGSTAYRVDYGGLSLCYVTDTEHKIGEQDERVLNLIEGADAVIYDTTYTDEEMHNRIGWGHSTWQEGVRLCRKAGVGQLYLFHHDCERNDAQMADLEMAARKEWSGVTAAREGMRVVLIP